MKRILLTCLLAACTNNANIGMSNQPVTCKPAAAGAANGTVSNPQTNKSYAFGSIQASLALAMPNTPITVTLDDSSLALRLMFGCGQPQLGMFDTGANAACPLSFTSSVSGNLQQVYGTAHSGMLIVDQNVGCLAGRYDVDFGYTMDNGTYVDEGSVAGWFSVPVQ